MYVERRYSDAALIKSTFYGLLTLSHSFGLHRIGLFGVSPHALSLAASIWLLGLLAPHVNTTLRYHS